VWRLPRRGGIGALACLLVLIPLRVRGQQATLLGDAHVSSARPSVNAGNLSNLDVGGGSTALVQFDLGTLPAGTTAAQITRATLRVYCNRADTPGAISVQAVQGSWSESGITYATLPALGPVVQTAQVSSAAQFVTFDITSTVQQWVGAPAANNGLALTASSAMVQFDSKENDQTAHAPQLEIALSSGGSGSGTAGAVGATGATGATGAIGAAGPAGPIGAVGLTGLAGATGATGAAGLVGAKGATGAVGATGPAGTGSGEPGATGATGSPGLIYQGTYNPGTNYAANDVVIFAGSSYVSLIAPNHGNTPSLSPELWGPLTAQGPIGLTGATGVTGALGSQGLPGPVGPPGEQGQQGAQGIAGQAGAQGIPGVIGATGLQGPMGPQGEPGPAGLSFQGNYSATTNYSIADGVLWQGASWVSLIANNHGNAPDQSPAAWAMFAASGAPGATGAIGATGQAGAAGLPGAAGAAGATGVTGAQGATGTPGLAYQGTYVSTSNYALGDVVLYLGTSYASLTSANHGNAPDQNPTAWGVLAPMGSTGPAGAAGPAGATGSVGPAGMQGLPGPIGALGPQGPQGLQGPAGAQGLAGAVGVQGPAGPQGLQGAAGTAGAQGVAGVAGATGPVGPAGLQGVQGATGAQGVTGANGAVGMNFRGAWAPATNYAVNDAVTFSGSTYLAQTMGTNLEPDSHPQAWTVIAQAGGAGPTGAAGTAATVAIGTITTLAAGASATVTNTGTAQAAVLNFGVPQGAAGAAGSGGGGGAASSNNAYAGMYHLVSFSTLYYAVNSPNADEFEKADVLAWVPLGCTATRMDVYSQQSGNLKVTLRTGTPGAMADTALVCSPATGSSCSVTGSVLVSAGNFIDFRFDGPSGTPAGVWTSLQCN